MQQPQRNPRPEWLVDNLNATWFLVSPFRLLPLIPGEMARDGIHAVTGAFWQR